MPINASNYVVNIVSPSVPRITVNVQSATGEEIANASSAYIASANEYATKYVETVALRDYVTDRLMKDMAADVSVLTNGGIFYAVFSTYPIASHPDPEDSER